MTKIKISANNLVTLAEFRKKISGLEIKIEEMGNGLREEINLVKGEMGEMETRLKA